MATIVSASMGDYIGFFDGNDVLMDDEKIHIKIKYPKNWEFKDEHGNNIFPRDNNVKCSFVGDAIYTENDELWWTKAGQSIDAAYVYNKDIYIDQDHNVIYNGEILTTIDGGVNITMNDEYIYFKHEDSLVSVRIADCQYTEVYHPGKYAAVNYVNDWYYYAPSPWGPIIVGYEQIEYKGIKLPIISFYLLSSTGDDEPIFIGSYGVENDYNRIDVVGVWNQKKNAFHLYCTIMYSLRTTVHIKFTVKENKQKLMQKQIEKVMDIPESKLVSNIMTYEDY